MDVRAVVGLVADPFLVVDAQGLIVSANAAALELLGLPSGSGVGLELGACVQDPEGAQRLLAEALCAPGVVRGVIGPQTTSEPGRRLDAALSRLSGSDQTLVGALLRPRAQGPAENAASGLLRAMLEQSPDQIAVIDREGRLLALSRTAEGVPVEKVLGRTVFEFTEPEGRVALEDALARAESDDGVASYEAFGRTVGGSRRAYSNRLKRVRVDGRTLFVIVGTETTALRQLEARKEALRTAMDHALDALVRVDPTLQVSWVNAAYAKLVGRPAEGLCGASWLASITPGCHGTVREAVASLPEKGRADLVVEAVRADGSLAPWGLTLVAARDAAGGPDGLFCFARDLSEQQAAHAHAVVADRLASVGMLASSVAHEVNNPLSAILSNLQFARRELAQLAGQGPDPRLPPLIDVLDDTLEAAERVRDIARDLRTFGHSKAPGPEPIELWPVIEAAIRLARNEVQHRARLVIDRRESPRVLGSAGRLGQVFLNLVVNAAQAIPGGDAANNEVRVRLGAGQPGEVRVEVSDTGKGMDEETLGRLFQPFFTTRSEQGGTGLGLSIARRIVAEHRGRLEVRSTPGTGTIFTVVLPTTDPPAVAASVAPPPAATPSPPARGSGGSVLIVDDDPLVLRGLSRALGSRFEVTCAPDAAAALNLLQLGRTFDAVVCDVMMPQLTGPELYTRLEKLDAPLARRFAFVTGGLLNEHTRAALAGLPCRVLEKPLQPHDLVNLVGELVQTR
jgi:PAS domain S-box-containing protein